MLTPGCCREGQVRDGHPFNWESQSWLCTQRLGQTQSGLEQYLSESRGAQRRTQKLRLPPSPHPTPSPSPLWSEPKAIYNDYHDVIILPLYFIANRNFPNGFFIYLYLFAIRIILPCDHKTHIEVWYFWLDAWGHLSVFKPVRGHVEADVVMKGLTDEVRPVAKGGGLSYCPRLTSQNKSMGGWGGLLSIQSHTPADPGPLLLFYGRPVTGDQEEQAVA